MLKYPDTGLMMEDIFFVGIKHSGKTTFASMIASRWNYHFMDSDDLILSSTGERSIRSLFLSIGKEKFMDLERECVESFLKENRSNLILSLGGGASDNENLIKALKQYGKIVYLYRKEELILPVILRDGVPPFLDKDDIEGSFHALFERRNNIYRTISDITIDMGGYGEKKDIADHIEKTLKDNGYGL